MAQQGSQPQQLNDSLPYEPGAEIGQEKAQSVIDSITSSYAAEGQQAPNMMAPGAFPPPFGFPGTTIPPMLP